MHFTVVFDSQERLALAFGLVFKPTPVWVADEEDLIVLRSVHASFERGDLQPLLDHPMMKRDLLMASRSAIVVVHDSGYGTEHDLAALVADLEAADFSVKRVRFGGDSPKG